MILAYLHDVIKGYLLKYSSPCCKVEKKKNIILTQLS